MTPDELVAQVAVRDVIDRYCLAMDTGRLDDLLTLFAPDGTFTVYDRSATGPEAINGLLAETGRAAASYPHGSRPRHHVTTCQIDLSADRSSATARTYFLVLTGEGLDQWGEYRDAFTRTGDAWVLTAREIRVSGATPGGLGEHLANTLATTPETTLDTVDGKASR